MITAITMNVSIDKRYEVDACVPGQVQRVTGCEYSAGGKGLNVARVLRALGEDVTASGLVGGHAGEWVTEALDREGVPHAFGVVPGETRSCINIIEPDGRQTEFLEPGFSVAEEDRRRYALTFEELAARSDLVTLSGSLPRGYDDDAYAGMIEVCHRLGKPVLLDASGRRLILGVKARPTLVKPNMDEIAQILGRAVPKESLADAAYELHRQGVPYVVVSAGKDGAYLACEEGVFKATPPAVRCLNATGCGDSMIAGFAAAMVRGMAMPDALRFATAVSASNAMHAGTGCIDPSQLDELQAQSRVLRL